MHSTAAYAVSQPLFDALRAATATIDEQRLHLTTARDLVQQLHIQAPHANGPKDMDRYEHFLDSATRAWKITTEAYSNIFDALANITGPDTATGREASEAHERFQAMADTAAKAKRVVAGHMNTGSSAVAEAEKAENEEASDTNTSTAKSRKRLSPWGSSAPLEYRPPKMQKTVKTATPRRVDDARSEAIPAAEPTDPQVEYEDVSAEVAARLRAKEDKKQAKKAAKKRKRESGDSFLEVAANAKARAEPHKPIQKKAKKEDVVPSNGKKAANVKVKRKKEEATGESHGNKKRKT